MVAGNNEVGLALLVALLPAFYALVGGVLELSQAGNKEQIWVEPADVIHDLAVQVKFVFDLEHLRIVSLELPVFLIAGSTSSKTHLLNSLAAGNLDPNTSS